MRFISHFLNKVLGLLQKFVVSITVEMSEPTVVVLLSFIDPKLFPALNDDALVKVISNPNNKYLILLFLGHTSL